MDIETLSLLEKKIEGVLTQHQNACEERDRLSQQLMKAEERVQELEEQVRRSEAERNEVRLRVEKILERLNGMDLN